jgi:hypothetical protein
MQIGYGIHRGASLITTFADPLVTSPLAADWSPGVFGYSTDGSNRFSIAVSASGLQFGNAGAGNGQGLHWIACNQLSALNRSSQRSKATLAGNVNGLGQIVAGPAVFIGADSTNGWPFSYYVLTANFASGHYDLTKVLATYNANTTPVLLTVAQVPVVGDIVEITADRAVAGQTTIRCYVNAILIGTYVDSSATRLNTGLPGIAAYFCSQSAISSWNTFSGGAL